jgi:hypothetical protein
MTPNLSTPYGVSLEVLNSYLKSLYDANWEDPCCTIRIGNGIRAEELAGAEIFHNARIFLHALLEEGGAPVTATGNLTRAFVGRMFDRLRLDSKYREITRSVCKVINEQDLWVLHEVRLLAEYGKLLARRNQRFTITKLGRELLSDERAGEFFRRLFLTYFRKLDLCYVVNVREQPAIQATLAITLWRLEQVAENWRPVKGLAAQVLPPRVLAQIVAGQQSEFDTPDFFVSAYVLGPLRDFGLLERERESEWRLGEEDSVRVTPLFRRFIRFAEIPSVSNN